MDHFDISRLNCLACYLPSAISQPALCIVDDLLVATVAGCAGDDSATNLTAATQGRTLLAMRHGGVLSGAATTASAQHISCVAAAERFISKIGAALEWRGTEPRALRRLWERIQAREANVTLETLTPLEACLVNEIELINTAHGYLGSSPDPGCLFPASTSPKNTGEWSKIILFNEYDKSKW